MAVVEKFRFSNLMPSEFIGLTTDEKPTEGVLPFSTFVEVDGNGNIADMWLFDGTVWNH